MSCTSMKCFSREWRNFPEAMFALVLFVLVTAALSAAQATFTSIFDFNGTDGSQPYYVYLVQGTDGQLYGTASGGGTAIGGYALGTAYKITTAGTFTQLYSFCSQTGCADGGLPYAGLVMAGNGNFYGTTTCDNGCTEAPFDGTIFEMTPSGTYSVLHTFVGTDGSGPYTNMTLGNDGNLYGTTIYGGNLSLCGGLGCGTVFKITPQGKFTQLYVFQGGSDGNNPTARLFQGSNGNFYGATIWGGNYTFTGSGGGTVFEITPAGKLTTLYSFCSQAGCPDGAGPYGAVVQTANGTIYGTTAGGGANAYGTLFKLVGKKLTTSYNFCSVAPNCTDGNYPYGGLIQASDGNLYGTTNGGGPNAGGTVFEFTPAGTLTTLYSFCSQAQCADGSSPYGGGLLQATDGNFYGTTYQGGISGALGTIFKISNGLSPFVQTVTNSGKVAAKVTILGTNLTGATAVSFNGTAATFKVATGGASITTSVPAGATCGTVKVATPSSTLSTPTAFKVLAQVSGFNPSSGTVGTSVAITGASLSTTKTVTFGGVKATSFSVNSDTQVTATVPTGAKTGKIGVTTCGGSASSATSFTVN